jgi:hypothetical protein
MTPPRDCSYDRRETFFGIQHTRRRRISHKVLPYRSAYHFYQFTAERPLLVNLKFSLGTGFTRGAILWLRLLFPHAVKQPC